MTLAAKNKVEVWILGKATESEQTSSADEPKDVMIRSMEDSAEIVAGVPELGFRAEDARAIGVELIHCPHMIDSGQDTKEHQRASSGSFLA